MMEFLNTNVPIEGIYLSYLNGGVLLLLLITAIFLNIWSSRFIRRSKIFEGWDLRRKRLLFNVIRILIWTTLIGLILAILGLNIGNFWDFKILGSSKAESDFALTPKNIFFAFIILIVTRILLIGLERVFSSGSHFREGNKGKTQAVYKFISYFVWVVAFLLMLGSTGINLTLLFGASAALLVGIGFGLQQIFSDLVSGIFLLFEGNLREGDVVELNNGIIGKVSNVGIRTSKILTRDDYIMIIPNSQFITKEVINWTHNEDNTRFQIDVGVAYGSDVRLVERVLLACANGNSEISELPKSFVRFNDFGDSSLDFQLFFWSTKTFRIENLKSDLRFLIDEKFRSNNIQIPFPQRDLHIIRSKV